VCRRRALYRQVIHKDLFARAYRLSQLHKEVATAIIYPSVRWDIAFPIVLQQVCVQVFAPIGLVAVTTSPSIPQSCMSWEWASIIPPLSRLLSQRIAPQYRAIYGGDVYPHYHVAPGFRI
jgi:hypothetical protein